MQKPPRSYVICGTPRTGSTLLCSLLYSTGVLGLPESYFREPHQDIPRMGLLMETIRKHNATWRAWFDAQGVEPQSITYEQLVGDRRRVIADG